MEETKYRRPDIEGGYIYDKSDIAYYRAIQKNDVMDNLLLGDFNMVGAYVVNNSIIEELIKITKIYSETYTKTILCESVKKFYGKSLKFALKIVSGYPSKDKLTANLELQEEINKGNGLYKNINSVLIDSKVFNNTTSIEKIYNYYNIKKQIDDSGDNAKIEDDFETRHIKDRLDTLSSLQKATVDTKLKYDKKLYNQRISALLKSKASANILEEFNKRVFHAKDLFLNKNSKQYYRQLNQILDSVLETYGYELQEDASIRKKLNVAQNEYVRDYEKLDLVIGMKLDRENVTALSLDNHSTNNKKTDKQVAQKDIQATDDKKETVVSVQPEKKKVEQAVAPEPVKEKMGIDLDEALNEADNILGSEKEKDDKKESNIDEELSNLIG